MTESPDNTPHAQHVIDLYAARARGDTGALLSGLAPNVMWAEAEGSPYGGTYIGPQAVLRSVFMRLANDWDDFTATPTELVDGDDTIVVIGDYRGVCKTTHRRLHVPFAHVWKLEHGKVRQYREHTDTAVMKRVMGQGA